MGYTHYWRTNNCRGLDAAGMKAALPFLKQIAEEHKDILCFESDAPQLKPQISETEIRLNGKGKDGHETFYFQLGDAFAFCKTAAKPYDLPVCKMLLVLKHFCPNMSLTSDGFRATNGFDLNNPPENMDTTWDEALAYFRALGLTKTAEAPRGDRSARDGLKKLIEEWCLREGTEPDCGIRDLLTDLMHIAKEMGVDFESVALGAWNVFQEEQEEATA